MTPEEISQEAHRVLHANDAGKTAVKHIFDAVGVRIAVGREVVTLPGEQPRRFVKTHNNPRNLGRTADNALLHYLKTLGEKQ